MMGPEDLIGLIFIVSFILAIIEERLETKPKVEAIDPAMSRRDVKYELNHGTILFFDPEVAVEFQRRINECTSGYIGKKVSDKLLTVIQQEITAVCRSMGIDTVVSVQINKSKVDVFFY